MKFSVTLLLCLFLFAGCGEKEGHTPVISDLTYAPGTSALGSGGGLVRVDFEFRYFDSNSDVKKVTFIQSVSGNPISTQSFDTDAALTEGKIGFFSFIDTTTEQTLDLEIYVTDSEDNRSNSLTGSFIVNSL